MRVDRFAVFTLAGLAVCIPALGQPKVVDGLLVNRAGLTLYVFDNDVVGSGRSVCNLPCSNLHPPYALEKGARPQGEFSAVTRDDGSRQWAYKGKPLYLWYADEKPGQTGGDGISRNTWHVARP
jgi:predicted lipoprotein with Yx(FWY)xxD motif